MTTVPLDLDAVRDRLAEASESIDHPDATYNPSALTAMRTAERLVAEVERLRSTRRADVVAVAAQVLHYAEGTIAPVAYLPESCGTCERATELAERALAAPPVGGSR